MLCYVYVTTVNKTETLESFSKSVILNLELVPFKRHSLTYNLYVLFKTGQREYNVEKGRQKVGLSRMRIIRKQISTNLIP